MAIPWSIAATGWTVTVVGWLLSPIISMILNKLSAYLIFDASKELDKLEEVTVPALRETLRDVEEQRMVMRDVMSGSDLQRLDKLDTRLKSALCQAEDILDLVDYHRIEKELTGGDDGRWVQRLIQAAGASIVALGRGSWASVQRVLHASGACIAFYCIDITPAPLLQLVHSMKQKLGQFFGGWSSGEGVLPVSQATSTVGVQRLCGWCSHLTSCCRSVFSWSAQRIAEARGYRDWSYEQVGIKSDLQKDGNVPITGRIRLRKQIQGIADILTSSKKSNLLNQNSSSTSKNSAKESSSKQKEIDELYRVIEQKVFGRDKDREDIIRMLREGPDTNAPSSSTVSPYSVIGIYGITGSGKSTLAQYVCDHEKNAGHFDPVMFVLVGKTFSVGNIFRHMLEQITQSRPSKDNDLESLKAELKKELKDKCFLLVLDDVWVNGDNMKERRILLDVLLVGQSGSRILVTAQKTDAAAALGAQEKMQIPIPDLEEEQYLSMFMHYALEDSQVTRNDYERYKAIGRKITKKLRRSPIAAITVAARLKSESRIDFWERTSNLDVLDETMGALWWSYQQLGVDIRRCFTYCSIFPKAYILRRDQIVDLWIAQGFVNTRSNGTEELDDIGQSYFDELRTFSFLQVRRRTILGEAVDFTIHDLLHELAERVSGSEFYRIVSNSSPKEIPRGVHHLFIETNNGSEIVEKILDMGNLRTLIIIPEPRDTMEKYHHDLVKVTDRLFMSLRKLRVLIVMLQHCRNELSVPVSIYQMKHLRYLRLDFFVRHLILPSTFSKLYHIQTIDIRCHRASYPENMANLIYLRYISAPVSFPNIGRLTSLQTIEVFRVKETQGYELKQLMHLNKLRGSLIIQGLEVVGSKEEALEAHLCNKKRLKKLKLNFGLGNRVGPDMEAEVLEGLCPPKDLQELTISRYNGSRYPSWVLSGHHPDAPKHLHKLELHNCSQLAAIPEDNELFIGLRVLCIYLCDWDRLPENMECLVSLQSLWIWNCDKIELLPTLPHQALKTIDIQGCPVLSRTCKEEGHPNWDKIQHIPEQRIED